MRVCVCRCVGEKERERERMRGCGFLCPQQLGLEQTTQVCGMGGRVPTTSITVLTVLVWMIRLPGLGVELGMQLMSPKWDAGSTLKHQAKCQIPKYTVLFLVINNYFTFSVPIYLLFISLDLSESIWYSVFKMDDHIIVEILLSIDLFLSIVGSIVLSRYKYLLIGMLPMGRCHN